MRAFGSAILIGGYHVERTFIMIKPDGVQRGLIGEIISRFERKGLKLIAAKLLKVSEEQARAHYAEHTGKPFYPSLIDFITSGPVLAMVWQGDDAIQHGRALIGKTNPLEAAAGTIRGDYGIHTNRNLIHGADSRESAEREIAIYFAPDELIDYELAQHHWI